MDKSKSTWGGPGRGGGRKSVGDAPVVRKQVTLPPEIIERALEIGKGNLSAGLRAAVAAFRD